MIMNAIQTFEEFNKTGIDNVFVYIMQNNSFFTPMILVSIFFVVLISTYFGTMKYGREENFWACAVAAMTSTWLVAIVLNFTTGLIGLNLMVLCSALLILAVAVFFLTSKDR